jgi:hypothetical protein
VPNLSLSGVSLVDIFGGGGLSGTITFQEGNIDGPDGPDFTYSMVLVGGAVGVSEGIPLKKWEFAKQILEDSKIARILKYVADNGGLSYANLPSWTEGSCFRNKYTISRLQSSDFLGDCATIFVSGNAGLGGDGFYLLLFGLPTGFWFWPTTRAALQTGMIGPDVVYNFKGFAVIYSLGATGSGSVGAAANAMCGRIRLIGN